MTENTVVELVQPIVNGEPFRCDCGSNVFKRNLNIYTCNACGEKYEGSSTDPS